MKLLTIIQADDTEYLQRFKDQATVWLPEIMKDPPTELQPTDVICTTKEAILEMISTAIVTGNLNHKEVIFIKADSTGSIAYTFDQQGNFNNFFRVGKEQTS